MDATTNQLPEAARAKLTAIRRQLEDASTLARASGERARVLEGVLHTADPAERHSVESELAEERDLQRERSELRNRLATVVNRVLDFLDKNPSLAPYSGKIEVGDWTLESVREKIGTLTREARGISKEPPTAEDVKAKARERLSRLGEPSLSPDGKVSFPRSRAETIAPDRDSALLAACYAVSPDETLALIDRLAEQAYPATGLAETDRRIKSRDLQNEVIALERIEEALVERALSQGLQVTRRPGASPLAILGLVHAGRRTRAAA